MKKAGSSKGIRAYCYSFTLYPESQQEVIEYVQENFSCAWALHDKDVFDNDDEKNFEKKHKLDSPVPVWPHSVGDLKKPHIHFLVKFRNQRYLTGVAKELQIPPNDIEVVKSEKAMFDYLSHKGFPKKYQYGEDVVQVHDYDAPDDNNIGFVSEAEQVSLILSMPPDCNTTAKRAQWALDNGCWAIWSKHYSIFKDIWHEQRVLERCQHVKKYSFDKDGFLLMDSSLTDTVFDGEKNDNV